MPRIGTLRLVVFRKLQEQAQRDAFFGMRCSMTDAEAEVIRRKLLSVRRLLAEVAIECREVELMCAGQFGQDDRLFAPDTTARFGLPDVQGRKGA